MWETKELKLKKCHEPRENRYVSSGSRLPLRGALLSARSEGDVSPMRRAQVRLVVLDSVAFHYRQDFADLSQRTRILNEASLLLMSLADTFQLAVRMPRIDPPHALSGTATRSFTRA